MRAARVRERLLDDAVNAESDGGRKTTPAFGGIDSSTATPARRVVATSASTSASCGCGSRSAGASLRRTPRSRRRSVRASRAAPLSEANSATVAEFELVEAVRGGLGLDGDHRHVMGNDVVHFAGDTGSLLEDGPSPLVESLWAVWAASASPARREALVASRATAAPSATAVAHTWLPDPEPDRDQGEHEHRPRGRASVPDAGRQVGDKQREHERHADLRLVSDERDEDGAQVRRSARRAAASRPREAGVRVPRGPRRT